MLALALKKIFRFANLAPLKYFHYTHIYLCGGPIKILANFVNIFTYNPGALFKDEIIADTIAGNYYWLTGLLGESEKPPRRGNSILKSGFFKR